VSNFFVYGHFVPYQTGSDTFSQQELLNATLQSVARRTLTET